MTNFFYTDTNNQKQLVDDQRLKELVAQGLINPHTPLETVGGHKGLAGQIPGLFDVAPSPFSQTGQAQPPIELFCTNCGNSISEQATACMSCGARPTGHKKFCRRCGVALNPEQVICVKCGTPLAGNSGAFNAVNTINTLFNAADPIKKLNTYFKAFWICFAVGFPLCLIVIGIPIVIAGVVFGCMLQYQLWKLIPADIARTTPGKAIGFCFIPFFNLYWAFVAYKGLGEDMNKTLQQRGIQYQVNEGLGLTFCVLWIVGFILSLVSSNVIVNSLLSLAGLIVLICFFKSVKDGAIALLEQMKP